MPLKKRFRANLGDLVLSNTISAERASSLFSDVASSGARHVRDLTRVGGPKHRHRNLLTRLLRGNQWPALYRGEVRFWNPRARAEQFAKIPLLLPHEVVGTVRKKNATSEAILARTSFDTMDIEYMAGLEGKVGATLGSMLGLALCLDEVAARWDRTESIDTVVLSFPGWAGRWRDAKIPLAAIEHTRQQEHDARYFGDPEMVSLPSISWPVSTVASRWHSMDQGGWQEEAFGRGHWVPKRFDPYHR